MTSARSALEAVKKEIDELEAGFKRAQSFTETWNDTVYGRGRMRQCLEISRIIDRHVAALPLEEAPTLLPRDLHVTVKGGDVTINGELFRFVSDVTGEVEVTSPSTDSEEDSATGAAHNGTDNRNEADDGTLEDCNRGDGRASQSEPDDGRGQNDGRIRGAIEGEGSHDPRSDVHGRDAAGDQGRAGQGLRDREDSAGDTGAGTTAISLNGNARALFAIARGHLRGCDCDGCVQMWPHFWASFLMVVSPDTPPSALHAALSLGTTPSPEAPRVEQAERVIDAKVTELIEQEVHDVPLSECTSIWCRENRKHEYIAEIRTPAPCEDRESLDWLEKRSTQLDWDDDGRAVTEIRGNVNDREWHTVGTGRTLREAIDAARIPQKKEDK